MRLLLFLVLTAAALMAVFPAWLTIYIRSQLWYLISFDWLREIRHVAAFWEWIPAQCSISGGFGLLAFTHTAIGQCTGWDGMGWHTPGTTLSATRVSRP